MRLVPSSRKEDGDAPLGGCSRAARPAPAGLQMGGECACASTGRPLEGRTDGDPPARRATGSAPTRAHQADDLKTTGEPERDLRRRRLGRVGAVEKTAVSRRWTPRRSRAADFGGGRRRPCGWSRIHHPSRFLAMAFSPSQTLHDGWVPEDMKGGQLLGKKGALPVDGVEKKKRLGLGLRYSVDRRLLATTARAKKKGQRRSPSRSDDLAGECCGASASGLESSRRCVRSPIVRVLSAKGSEGGARP